MIDNTIVGTVSNPYDDVWFACGCRDDWEDVDLGSFEGDSGEQDAKARVEEWVRAQ